MKTVLLLAAFASCTLGYPSTINFNAFADFRLCGDVNSLQTLWPDWNNNTIFHQCITLNHWGTHSCPGTTLFSFWDQVCVWPFQWRAPPDQGIITPFPTTQWPRDPTTTHPPGTTDPSHTDVPVSVPPTDIPNTNPPPTDVPVTNPPAPDGTPTPPNAPDSDGTTDITPPTPDGTEPPTPAPTVIPTLPPIPGPPTPPNAPTTTEDPGNTPPTHDPNLPVFTPPARLLKMLISALSE